VADSDRILQFLDDVHAGTGDKVKYAGAAGAASTNVGIKKDDVYAPFFPMGVSEAPALKSPRGDDLGPFQCRQSFKAFNAMENKNAEKGMGFSSDRARALNLLFSKQLNAYVLYFNWVSPEGYARTMQAKGVAYVPFLIPFKRSIIDFATKSTRKSF